MKREKFDQLKAKFDAIDDINIFLTRTEEAFEKDTKGHVVWSLAIEAYGLEGHHISLSSGYLTRVSVTKEDLKYIANYFKEKKNDLEREVDAEW